MFTEQGESNGPCLEEAVGTGALVSCLDLFVSWIPELV